MRRRELSGRNSGRGSVGVKSRGSTSLAGSSNLKFTKITMVISLHFVVEDLGLFRGGVGDERIFNDGENIVTDLNKLLLDFGLVVLDNRLLVSISLLLDGGDYTPGCAAGSNDVFVGNREKVALLYCEFLRLREDE